MVAIRASFLEKALLQQSVQVGEAFVDDGRLIREHLLNLIDQDFGVRVHSAELLHKTSIVVAGWRIQIM
jgi:hypothetical protein